MGCRINNSLGTKHWSEVTHCIKKWHLPFSAAVAGSRFDRFAAQMTTDIHSNSDPFRFDEFGGDLKANF